MPRLNRSEICARDEVQALHLINRCVRRTYLCGQDKRSGRDYSHRKQWIRQRLEELAGIFGMDLVGFAVMSNHLHVVIRNDVTGLAEKRRRLSDVSWFMRCLVEPIARHSNKEDEVTGRFWEGRFKAQPLLDDAAIAACMAYVDLNPIRAGIAATPERSDFTSVQARIDDRQSAAEVSSIDAQDARIEHGPSAGWLSPIGLQSPRKKVRGRPTSRRASIQGCLPMTLDDYLKLIDWAGRHIHKGKGGSIPSDCLPLLERLQCDVETCLDFVQNFRNRFRNEAGLAPSRMSFRILLAARRQAPLAT